jgi:hypothetical protein
LKQDIHVGEPGVERDVTATQGTFVPKNAALKSLRNNEFANDSALIGAAARPPMGTGVPKTNADHDRELSSVA